jgi:8-oxo-dGTP pyrophosphatase MutT (NUDIX family)
MIRITIGRKKMALEGAVMVIINDADEVLLLERPENVRWAPNQWGYPGGKIEPGEDPLTAAVRETKEETTLDVRNPKKIKVSVDQPIAAYYTREYLGSVQIDFEHTDWAWVGRSTATTYDLAPGVLDLYDWVIKNGK